MPAPRHRTSPFRAILRIAKKELLASLRDRQTAIYTFVLPICLYPVIFWVAIQGALLFQGRREHTTVSIGLARAADAVIPEGLPAALAGPLPADPEGSGQPIRVIEVDVREEPATHAEAEAWALREGSSDADALDAVLFLAAGDEARAELFYDSTESRATVARARIEERLPPFAQSLRAQRAIELSVAPDRLDPIAIEMHDVAPSRDRGAVALSMMLPMLLVIMAVMGAFFPAVDLTAGEKERGTAETTMLLPVPRAAIHEGKILAVCATAVIACFLNLLAIGLSADHLLASLGSAIDFRIELPVTALLAVAPLALLFAFFVSAVLTGVAGLAASFKEGQAMLGPTQMLFILPAVAGIMPGLELSPAMAFVPVLNVVLAFKAMLVGKALYLEYALTAGALLAYALAAIAFAVRLLSRESVALSGKTLPLTNVLRLLRSGGAHR